MLFFFVSLYIIAKCSFGNTDTELLEFSPCLLFLTIIHFINEMLTENNFTPMIYSIFACLCHTQSSGLSVSQSKTPEDVTLSSQTKQVTKKVFNRLQQTKYIHKTLKSFQLDEILKFSCPVVIYMETNWKSGQALDLLSTFIFEKRCRPRRRVQQKTSINTTECGFLPSQL